MEHTESDVVTLHNYAENGEQLKAVYDSLEDALQNNKTAGVPHKFAFAKGFSYAGQPVMLSEFAGISFEKDRAKGWGYGEPVKDEQSFLARLSSLVSAVRAEKGFCGYCITATDGRAARDQRAVRFSAALQSGSEKIKTNFLGITKKDRRRMMSVFFYAQTIRGATATGAWSFLFGCNCRKFLSCGFAARGWRCGPSKCIPPAFPRLVCLY